MKSRANSNKLCSFRLELGVEKLIQHPDYDPTYTNLDFSLLKLESPVDFSAYPHIRPVSIFSLQR